jgi:hypothetical protein
MFSKKAALGSNLAPRGVNWLRNELEQADSMPAQ